MFYRIFYIRTLFDNLNQLVKNYQMYQTMLFLFSNRRRWNAAL